MANIPNNDPKFDEDLVTLGYLKRAFDESKEDKTDSYSRNFGAQPTPPYHINDTWTSDKGLYKCVRERLIGNFDSLDWELVTIGDQVINNTVDTSYGKSTLSFKEQADNKIETWYKDMDPSLMWTTTIEKEKHIGDMWLDFDTGKQYSYNKMVGLPPKYEWRQIDAYKSVYNQDTGHRTIFLKKPEQYIIGDMWIIDIDTDVPENSIVGDIVVAQMTSDSYNKEHFNKDHLYIKQLEIIDNYISKDEAEGEIEEKITVAKGEISNIYETRADALEQYSILQKFIDGIRAGFSLIGGSNLWINSIQIFGFKDIINNHGIISLEQSAEISVNTLSNYATKITNGGYKRKIETMIDKNYAISISFKCEAGSSKIIIKNGNETIELINANNSENWQSASFLFVSRDDFIEIEFLTDGVLYHSDGMLNLGSTFVAWQLSASEILGNVLKLSYDGLNVKSEISETDVNVDSAGFWITNFLNELVVSADKNGIYAKNQVLKESLKISGWKTYLQNVNGVEFLTTIKEGD